MMVKIGKEVIRPQLGIRQLVRLIIRGVSFTHFIREIESVCVLPSTYWIFHLDSVHLKMHQRLEWNKQLAIQLLVQPCASHTPFFTVMFEINCFSPFSSSFRLFAFNSPSHFLCIRSLSLTRSLYLSLSFSTRFRCSISNYLFFF